MPAAIDLSREDKRYYSAPKTPERVMVPELAYLGVTGTGAPGGPSHLAATEALYTVAYALRRRAKTEGMVFVLPKLEGLWWVDGPGDPLATPRDAWQWRLLIRLPKSISPDDVTAGRDAAVARKPELPPIQSVAFDRLTEGDGVQIMHSGPYDTEPATLDRLHRFVEEHGLRITGRHHEIYQSDWRRTPPERLRTILRYPVVPA